MWTTKGRSTRGMTGLGWREVSGRRRVPSPPTRITACISRSPSADALVRQPGGADRARIERVAAVDHELPAHRLGDRGPVEIAELVPLGHEHERVGVPRD